MSATSPAAAEDTSKGSTSAPNAKTMAIQDRVALNIVEVDGVHRYTYILYSYFHCYISLLQFVRMYASEDV